MWWKSIDDWTPSLIAQRIREIAEMEWIQVSDWLDWDVDEDWRKDDGQVGQVIERMFNVNENNDEAPDLPSKSIGTELKTLRTKSTMWTLKHCSRYFGGMTSREVFDMYSYPKKKRVSKDPDIYEVDPELNRLSPQFGYNDFSSPVRKHTHNRQHNEVGDHIISDYFSLRASDTEGIVEIHHRNDGYLASVDLRDKWIKLQKVAIILCESRGNTGTVNEEFKISHAFLLNQIKSSTDLLKADIISCTFSQSQSKPNYYPTPHNRSDKYRIALPKNRDEQLNKLNQVWEECIELYPEYADTSKTVEGESIMEGDEMSRDYNDEFIQGDVLTELKKIPDGTFDFALTSPPYNLKNSTGNGMKPHKVGKWSNAKLIDGYDGHGDSMPHEEYVAWQRDVIAEVMRTLKEDGAFFYNHKWRVQGGLIQDRSDIVEGFPVRQIIIWARKGGINFNPGYFLPTYEVIYVIAKKGFKLEKGANRLGDVWQITQDIKNPHPASFPLELALNVVDSCKGNLVLDPFMGSGTTAAAAKLRGKNYCGIERSEQYLRLAQERMEHIGKFNEDLNWRKKPANQKTLF